MASYDEVGRESSIAQATADARAQAVEDGAVADTVHVVDVEEIHLQYIPGGVVRLRVRVVGDLRLG